MEARFARAIFAMALLVGVWSLSADPRSAHAAAGYKTTNFVVSAPTPQLAKEIGDTAEVCRQRLSILWLGKEMPPWDKPCPIHAEVKPNLGAGGATSFVFDRGQVFGWSMKIQGSRERILDSVLPHEVTHTDLRLALSPAPAPLGRRRGLHHGRASQRSRQAGAVPDRISQDQPRHPVRRHVRHEGVPAGRDAALFAGPLTDAMVDREPRPPGVFGIPRRRHGR